MGSRWAAAANPIRARWPSLIVLLIPALLLLALLLSPPALAAEPKYPALTGRVVDEAGVLDAATQSELTAMLAEHERATGQQVVVVTLASLQGLPIEDFGYQLGRHWGIGQKGKNTGAMLIIAPKEHKVRIEVGYGLEGELTDAVSRVIIERDITPNFRRGDFNAGVLAGTTSLLKALGGNPSIQPNAESSVPADANAAVPNWLILLALAMWIIFMIIRNRSGARNDIVRHMGRTFGGFPGGGFPSGGYSGSGGGGFSGGGGSFGGGGASGSW